MIYFQPKIIKEETLNIIRSLESNDGKNLAHKSSAFGQYGIKPSTAKELGYHITKKNERKVASIFYDKITNQLHTQDPEIVVYAWLVGIYGAKAKINMGIPYKSYKNHWHVKKYRKHISYYEKFLIDTNNIFTEKVNL